MTTNLNINELVALSTKGTNRTPCVYTGYVSAIDPLGLRLRLLPLSTKLDYWCPWSEIADIYVAPDESNLQLVEKHLSSVLRLLRSK